jgi:hypothetical protein
MWCSTFRTITRENRPNISEFEKEWRTNKVLGRSPKGSRGVFSNFSYISARGYGIREGERAWAETLRIDCRMIALELHLTTGRDLFEADFVQFRVL